jgi:uncharacterized protein
MNLDINRLIIVSSVVLLGMVGCSYGHSLKSTSTKNPQNRTYHVTFSGIHAPVTDMEKRINRVSPSVVVNGQKYDLKYDVIARSGDIFKSGVFGRIYDQKGDPIISGGQPWDSVDMDHTTLLPRIDADGIRRLFAVTQFESTPGAFYMTELYQDASSGKLFPLDTQHIDDSHVNGSWVMCAGVRTPWLTHLSSEEYEPDAKYIETGKMKNTYRWDQMARYFDESNQANPYDYGWTPEIDIVWSKENKKFEPKLTKHYAMGRFSHELAYVMPDNKTVYLSDDGTNVGLFMFVADQEGDLSAGHLYAAKWIQTSDENGGEAEILWISLGWADNKSIKQSLDEKITFSDIFHVFSMSHSGECQNGRTINTQSGQECLKLKKGMEMIASRLETRRYAAYMGATTEFRKEEGITYDSQSRTLYIAMSEVARGMESFQKKGKPSDKYDKNGWNDIQLPYNACGTVYGMEIARVQKDKQGRTLWIQAWGDKNAGKNIPPHLMPLAGIPSHYVAINMKGVVSGVSSENKYTPYEGMNTCAIHGLANPDNMTMLEKSDILVIGEDSGSGHQNDAVWAFNVGTKKLTRIFTTPYGSEATSPYWYKDLNGHAYLMIVTQHPYGEGDALFSRASRDSNWIGNLKKRPQDSKGFVGYIYGFPRMR